MNRSDWVFVGVRLIGLILLCRSTLQLPDSLEHYRETHLEGVFVRVSRSGLAESILGWTLGIALFLGAPAIDRWLARKDARLES